MINKLFTLLIITKKTNIFISFLIILSMFLSFLNIVLIPTISLLLNKDYATSSSILSDFSNFLINYNIDLLSFFAYITTIHLYC